MTSADWNSWAACVGETHNSVDPSSCGQALQWATSATPAALHAATACVFDGENRSNVTYVADALHGIGFEEDKVVAIADALPGHFIEDRHSNIFAGSLTENGQVALGRVLDQVDEVTAELLFRLALRNNLTTLAGRFDDYDGTNALRSTTDEELIDRFAQQISNDHSYGSTERWALARSGTWTADDIVRCHTENLRGCDGWQGETPMSLLDEATERGEDPRTPGMITAAANQEGASRDDAGAALRWISATPGSGSNPQLRSMINGMTTPSFRDDFRYGVALAATAELCDVSLVSEAARRANVDEDQSQTSVWNTFLTRCNDEHWTWRERLELSAIGSDLNAHPTVLNRIIGSAETSSDAVTCAQLHTAADEIYEDRRAYDRPMTGLVYGLAADLRPDCFDVFQADLTRIAGEPEEHPESRYKAIEMLAENGESSFCGTSRASVRRWTPGEDQPGFTPLAEELELKAEDACP